MIRAEGLRVSPLTEFNLVAEARSRTWITSSDRGALSRLLRVLATIARPESGRLAICQIDAMARPLAARRHVMYIGRDPRVPHGLTVAEFLAFMARSRQIEARGGSKEQDPHYELAGRHGLPADAIAHALPASDRRRVLAAGAAAARVRVCLVELPDASATDDLALDLDASDRCTVVACPDAPPAPGWAVLSPAGLEAPRA